MLVHCLYSNMTWYLIFYFDQVNLQEVHSFKNKTWEELWTATKEKWDSLTDSDKAYYNEELKKLIEEYRKVKAEYESLLLLEQIPDLQSYLSLHANYQNSMDRVNIKCSDIPWLNQNAK